MRGKTGSGLQLCQAVHLFALCLRQKAVRLQPLQVRPVRLRSEALPQEAEL